IEYTVSEEGTEDDGTVKIGSDTYQVSVSGDMQNGYVITNSKKDEKTEDPGVEKTSVSVTKKWIGKVGKSVKINVMADGAIKDTVELTEDNQWKHTFIDLPKYNSVTNKPIQYTVFEEGIQGNGEINIGGTTYKVSTEGDIQRGYLVVNT